MRRRTMLAVARKDALDFLHNKSTLLVLSIPIFLSILLALLGNLVISQTSEVLVYNPSGSAVERVLTNSLSDTRIVHAHSAQEVADAFGVQGARKSTPYIAGLIVPADYEVALRAGRLPIVLVYVNGDDLSSEQMQLILDGIILYGRRLAHPQPPVNVMQIMINPPLAHQTARLHIAAFYALLTLLSAFVVGTTLVPSLLVEEKERKTLWMLLASPASLADIIGGKLLVGMGYQLLLVMAVLAVQHGFMGQVGFVLLFAVLGSALSIMLGLLVGSLFRTMSATAVMSGIVALIYIVPGLFVGPLGAALQESLLVKALWLLPTHYLAQGTLDALQNQGAPGELLLDAGIIAGCTLALFALAVWVLRRQASILSTL